MSIPLQGKTILVTRAAGQASQFNDRLTKLGATVIEMPTLEIHPPTSWENLDRAIANLADFHWLILTSTNAVDYFFARVLALGLDTQALAGVKIAVVGEKTSQCLKQHSLQPDFTPPEFVADSLVRHFPEQLAGKKVLFPRVETGGREVLVKEFTEQNAEVVEVAAYQSCCPATIDQTAKVALLQKYVDIITFASSKTVTCFHELLNRIPESDGQNYLDGVCLASIGPQTSKSCVDLLGRVDVEARDYTLDGLTMAISDWAVKNTL